MRRVTFVLLLVVALAGPVAFLMMRSAGASPGLTFTVNSTADTNDANAGDGICDDGTGSCTLRAAIEEANGDAGTDTIAFNIPGAGPHTIQPASALPGITDPVTIDGYTQPGASPNTLASAGNAALLIELNGASAGPGIAGLAITAGSSIVRGLVINRFSDDGIDLMTNGGNVIEGNFIGTNTAGDADLGNTGNGVAIVEAPNNTIGGVTYGQRNLIAGSERNGVNIRGGGATGNAVEGNLIGTDLTGTIDLGNTLGGVDVNSSDNAVGGPTGTTPGGACTGACNVISGNNGTAIVINNFAAGNSVKGNYIGINSSGTAGLANGTGVFVLNGAHDNTIGGVSPAERNVISGNPDGIHISTSSTFGNLVLGNYVGTNAPGTGAIPNSSGVRVSGGAHDNAIRGNLVSGNTNEGIEIDMIGSNLNVIMANYVGTDASGVEAIPNREGIFLGAGAQNNIIGGTAVGEGNVVAHSTYDGVRIHGASTTGNAIRGNSIHSNGSKGIENINGGNTELAPPIIDTVGASVSGHTNPKCYPCTVDVFSDTDGQGRIYHGSAATNDDATGTWTYPGTVVGPNITATITHIVGNTSEFSAPKLYPPPVGGIAELPDIVGASRGEAPVAAGGSGWSASDYAALSGGLAAAALATAAGAWYARRRWLR